MSPSTSAKQEAVAGQQLASKAVALGDAKALRKYLEASVDGNSRVLTGVIDGKTSWRLRLLHLAAFEGSVDTVLLLLSAGASVNAQDLDGWTPLMYAARNETDGEALVPTLIAAGAELDKKNNRGRTALHIAYLARNFQVVSELLEHGASDMVRDEIGKTPSQMLGQGKLVRRRPWSGSSAILGGSKELSACRRGLKCPERPRTASGLVDGKKRLLGRSSFGTESESEKRSFQPQDTGIEVGDSISTLKKHPDGAIREVNDGSITTAEAGPGNGGRGRGGGTHGETSPRACWRCHREIVILEGRGHQGCHLTGGSSGLAAPSWDSGGTGLGQKSLHICGSDDDGGKGEGSGFAFDSTYTSRTISRGHRQHRPCPLSPGADTLLVENSAFGTLSTDEQERHPRHADGFAAVNTPSEGGDSAILAKTSSPRGEEATAVELSASQLRRHDEEQEERFDVNGRVAVESQEPRQSATCRANGPRGGGEGSGHKVRRQSSRRRRRSRGGGRKRCKTNLIRGASLTGGSTRRRSRPRTGGGGAVAGRGGAAERRRFFYPGDEVPEHVIGRNRMIWAQKSATRYAQIASDALRRREANASPRRLKMAAAAEAEKRRKEKELRHKERIRTSPAGWGRDGRREGSPIRPSSSPNRATSPLSPPASQHRRRPSTAGPYGGRSCVRCDPRRWYRGEFMGDLGGSVSGTSLPVRRRGGRREGGGEQEGREWDRIVTDRYRLLRQWAAPPHCGSELWWAKSRPVGGGEAVVVKTVTAETPGERAWDAFAREWGVLKYLQEVGRPEGREALSVGLVDAFEKERSLVLSIPAGSRTLREVGQQIHKANGRRYKKKESTADGAIFDQVESLAVQACRAVCWFHRCGLVHGDLTPDNFVVLGGTAGLSSTSSSPITGRRFAHTAGACAGRGGFGGGGKVGGAARWEGKLRLMVGRSVSRRSDEAGGCPRHPLLEPVNRNFPTNEPFDKAYATPERVQASLYDAPWPAEVAEDAWAFGVIVRWLLTGRDECVPGSDVENPSGCVASAKVLDSLACPGNVCSILPGLLAADPRSRESALALAARHVSTKSRSPRTPPTSLRSSRRKRSPEGSPGAPSGRLSPRPSSTRAATNSLPAATAGGAEPAPHRGQGLQEKEENAEPPPNLEAAAAANALKERVVDRPPPVKTTASSQARGGRSADISGSRGVATGAGVGTSPRASGAHSGQVTSSSPVMSTLRATFKMGPSSSRRSKIMGSLPLVSAGAMQRATNRAARSALSGTKGRDRGGSGSSSDSSASSSSASAVVAAAAAGGEVLEDQGAPKAAGAGAEPASGGLERTLLVEFRSAELDGQSGDEEEDDRGGQPTANDFEATAAVDFSAEGGRGKVVGGREEILPTGGAEELEGEKIVPAGNGGNPLRNKKRSRVTPLGSGEPNNRRPVKGEVGSMAGRGSATTGGVNTGDGQNLRGGSSASGGVVGKKRLSDAGVQCARPAEGSELMGGGLGRGRCRCVVM